MAQRRARGSAPEFAEVGDYLRDVRKSRGLSLRALAERLGVSPSLISQVETGRAKPSVNTLYAIVSELGISLDELLFSDARSGGNGTHPHAGDGAATQVAGAPPVPAADVVPAIQLPLGPVQRSANRKTIRLASGVVWERLTTASIPALDFLFVTYEVGGASSPEDAFQRHVGLEFGYVLSGSLGVRIAFDEYLLEAGDSIAFDSARPHRLFNAGDVPVHAVWFVLGRGTPDLAHAAPAAAPLAARQG